MSASMPFWKACFSAHARCARRSEPGADTRAIGSLLEGTSAYKCRGAKQNSKYREILNASVAVAHTRSCGVPIATARYGGAD
eukprot:4597066-Amphidinium_carterae.1